MSRLTQARRWAIQEQHKGAAAMTEEAITPEEARTALEVLAMKRGIQLMPDNVAGRPVAPPISYDPKTDRFSVVGRSIADGKKREIWFPGGIVAGAVDYARLLAGRPGKQLHRRTVKQRRAANARGLR